jgi:2-amino-4-hydroxy-6-hydroxymethyldihydropteridine diphosphokinase
MHAYLALGSNMGNRLDNLKSAMSFLVKSGIKIVKHSSIYETLPAEIEELQDNYLNMAVHVSFDKGPFALLNDCRRIELLLGRKRPYFHSPRIIDIDILTVENILISTKVLKLPHPGIEKRAFVIWPLNDIAGNLRLSSGKTVSQAKNSLNGNGIVSVWKI